MTDYRSVEIEIQAEDEGIRLDVFLAGRYRKLSRRQWQDRINQGLVKVNSKEAKPSTRIRALERVTFQFIKLPEPPVETGYSVEFEDEWLLIINKPARLPVHPAGRYKVNTLYHLLQIDYGFSSIRILNRLDRETSGLLMVAKSRESAYAMQKLQRKKAIEKNYHVLVEGQVNEPFRAEGFIGLDSASPIEKKLLFIPESREGFLNACTDFEPVATGKGISLLKATLHTGRMHQIRATLNSLGYPVVGDKIYGIDPLWYLRFIHDELSDDDRKAMRIPRQALHSFRLAFIHPFTHKKIEIQTPCPGNFQIFSNNLFDCVSMRSLDL